MNRIYLPNSRTLRFLVFISLLGLFWFLGSIYAFDSQPFQDYLHQFPLFLSGIIFIGLYVVLTFFIWFGPKDILRIVGAILFGPLISTLLVWIGECFNAAMLFSISRHLGRDFIEKRFRMQDKQIDKVKDNTNFFGLVTLRINPLISFRFLDLAVGLTRISLWKYMLVVIFASPLRVFWLQWILADTGMGIFKDPKGLMHYFMDNPQVLFYSAIYFLIVIVLSLVSVIMKLIRKKNVQERNPK